MASTISERELAFLLYDFLDTENRFCDASATPTTPASTDHYLGKLQAMRYFFRGELPQTGAQRSLLAKIDRSACDMHDEWFA